MKLLLLLLLACRAAAVQNVFVQDDLFGDDLFGDDEVEIDTAGTGGDGGNADDLVKGSDVGTEYSGCDTKVPGIGNSAGVVKEGDVGSAEEYPGREGGNAYCYIEDENGGDDYFDDDYNYFGGIIQRIKDRDFHGVYGGLLPANPPPTPTLEFLADLNLGYKIRRQVSKETGKVLATIIKPSGQKEEKIIEYLIASFARLNLYEVLGVVKYRIQVDPVLAAFVSYMESDVFIGQRVQLKTEPSVKEFLSEPAESFILPVKVVYYENLRILIRRLFSSCPPSAIVRCDYDEGTVDTLLSGMSVTKVARVLNISIATKQEWLVRFEDAINHLYLDSTVKKLNAIRSSPTYKRMRTYLARKLNLESLDLILDSFFGFDLALIFSVYVMI